MQAGSFLPWGWEEGSGGVVGWGGGGGVLLVSPYLGYPDLSMLTLLITCTVLYNSLQKLRSTTDTICHCRNSIQWQVRFASVTLSWIP